MGPRFRGDDIGLAALGKRASSDIQHLAQILEADTELLQPRQFVEHAPLFGNAVAGDPENRNLLDLDAPPGRLDAPERALCVPVETAACDPVGGAENIHHLLMPVGERGPDPHHAETNAFHAAPLGNLRTRRPVRQEIIGIDALDQREVAGFQMWWSARARSMLFIPEPSRWPRGGKDRRKCFGYGSSSVSQ